MKPGETSFRVSGPFKDSSKIRTRHKRGIEHHKSGDEQLGWEGPGNMAEIRDYLAAERTFLAWIRTGLALMGFGFVVARFGLFLRQLELIQHAPPKSSYGLSLWFGTALIAAGVVVNLLSARRHAQLVRQMEQGKVEGSHSLVQAISVALFLAFVGMAMAVYLLFVHGS